LTGSACSDPEVIEGQLVPDDDLRTTSGFTDHFGPVAAAYRRHRPVYPAELFAWLAEQAPARERAWDCATGNGQAALGLAGHFECVHASDASPEQLRHAQAHPRVHYHLAPAEASTLPDGCIDLLTVAQAMHWFDQARFAREVWRVLRPGGVFAAWSYGAFHIDQPELRRIGRQFYLDIVGPYWPDERQWTGAGLADLSWPLPECPAPRFDLQAWWNLDDLLGYYQSWSATRRCREATGVDPLPALRERLAAHWGPNGQADAGQHRHTMSWELTLRVGRKPG